MHPEMKMLVIKPTLKCNANCLGCTNRKQQHSAAMRATRQLSLKQWNTVIRDAASLGAKELHISGGEPTFYENLVDLVREGKKCGMHVDMMSNGSGNKESYLRGLLEAGLDEICISLYSHQAEVHDKIRRSRNLWNKATETVRMFAKLGEEYPRFRLSTMSIIMKENYRTFDELIRFHRDLGSHGMTIAYLEGDFSKKNLLTEAQIMELKNTVIPRAIKDCEGLDPRIKDCSINILKGYYSDEAGSMEDFVQGIYWKHSRCEKSKGFALVWSDGSVLPCFMCEYTTEPVMGNIFEESLPVLWKSEKWNAFRSNLHEKCNLCPMNLHRNLPLRYRESKHSDQQRDMLHRIYHSRGFKPFQPLAKRIINLGRHYLS
jgi:MoaA/NifB/PqqE/SkfB family radical SAM enzyme